MGQRHSSAAIIPAPPAQEEEEEEVEEVEVAMATSSTSASTSSSAGDAPTTAQDNDVDQPESLKVFPAPHRLVPCCMQAYGWEQAYSERAVAVYGQFMALKREMEDWDANLLSPPPVIDQVWRIHVLDTNGYAKWCTIDGRRMVHYSPDPGFNKDGLPANEYHGDRIRYTVAEMKKHFAIDEEHAPVLFFTNKKLGGKKRKAGEHDSDEEDDDDEVEESDDEEGNPLPKRQRRCQGSVASSSSTSSQNSSSGDESDTSSLPGPPQQQAALPPSRQPLTIFVRWGQNPDPNRSQDLYFKIRPDTKMQRVFDRYTIYWNDAVANLPAAARGDTETMQDFVFFFGSRMVRPTDTASSLGLVADDMLYATRCSAVEDDDNSPAV